MMNDKYPIGAFTCPEVISNDQVQQWITELSTFPIRLKEVVELISEEALESTYREGSWNVRQIVHHLADSHMNAYIRLKLALTEENPTIKPYFEEKWAELPDYKLPITGSLKMIEAIHEHWVYLLENITEAQRKRTFTHPDSGIVSVEKNIGIYAWHSNHHLAHIKHALKQF